MLRLTRKSIAQHFPTVHSFGALEAVAKARQWKPSSPWLAGEGKRYGRLIIVSDTHVGPGIDPVTGKISPAEDFLPDRQEIDLHNMLSAEWTAAAGDGAARTLVLNGDAFEFMQTTTPPEGKGFVGPRDTYGPLNTARTAITKLESVYEGHPALFRTYASHLARGHRLVLVPGNHDRQLVHPAVRAALRSILRQELVAELTGDAGFEPKLAGAARTTAAVRLAKQILADRFEVHPHFFLLGDVFVQHGHQHDPSNSFSSLAGEAYENPLARDVPIVAALGDYFVKSVFNNLETKVPWGDNNGSFLGVAMAASSLRGVLSFPATIGRALRYVLTREGHGTESEEGALAAKERADIRRLVKDYRIAEKLNELRTGRGLAPLGTAETVDLLMEYQQLRGRPLLSFFRRGDGTVKRLVTLLWNLPTIAKTIAGRGAREEAANAFLFDRLGVKTHATGHDHTARLQRYLVGGEGNERLGQLMDDASWTDKTEQDPRSRMVLPTEQRGVITVDFSAEGSSSRLKRWDPARRQLVDMSVLETTEEARGEE